MRLNQLTGTIHTSIGAMDDLEHLGLQHNRLEGTIPTQMGNLFRVLTIQLSHNQLTGAIPTSLENLADLTTLHLEGNNFVGVTIPPQICAIEDLDKLVVDCRADKVTGTCCVCS